MTEDASRDTFPRRQAATRRFTLGAPRRATVSPDGARVVFLRSGGGDDPVTSLWTLDVATGEERVRLDPRTLDLPGDEDLPPEERARRERVREQSGGVVEYATDEAVRTAVVVLSGQAFLADLTDGGVTPLDLPGPVVDPRLDPTGARVAFVRGGALHVSELADGAVSTLAEPDAASVTWGLPDFVAAEEMGRFRGHWWSPDGASLVAARVDDADVPHWHIADPAHPDRVPTVTGYPAAGTTNARVSLAVLKVSDASSLTSTDRNAASSAGERIEVDLGDDAEYVAAVHWDEHALLVVVQPRDQRSVTVLAVDPATGASSVVRSDTDPAWVDLVPGVPGHLDDGSLVWSAGHGDSRGLVVNDAVVTGPELQVRSVAAVDGDTVLFTASTEPTSTSLWSWSAAAGVRRESPEHGIAGGHRGGGTTVSTHAGLDHDGAVTTVRSGSSSTVLESFAESPGLVPQVRSLHAGERALRTAVLLPRDHVPGSRTLPVLLDPYGGPHAQRVVDARGAYLTSQWFADQGFAVVVADGRGTPGRGLAFERAVHGDLAGPVLDDQVDALHAAAASYPDLDLSRVGIRGWSFGGFLAALAVLRRPDVFHAAVAGAPVTDWTLYDTHYTERYLGTPQDWPAAYERSSLLGDAAALERPLMLVHGLADDNVVAAHTLRLSSALLAAGRPHTVLPLSGVTHMTPQEVVAENLLRLQVDFLRTALGIVTTDRPS